MKRPALLSSLPTFRRNRLPVHLEVGSPGFTLIELLVTVTIMLFLVGGGIASFINFNEKQALTGAGQELKTYLRSAQIKARNGDRPENCDKLKGYVVVMVTGLDHVSLRALCEGAVSEVLVATYALGNSVTSSTNTRAEFLVLHGGTNGTADFILRAPSGKQYGVTVTQGGEIQDKGILTQTAAPDVPNVTPTPTPVPTQPPAPTPTPAPTATPKPSGYLPATPPPGDSLDPEQPVAF